MSNRANYYAAAPEAVNLLLQQETLIKEQFTVLPTLNLTIWELVKLRISQINQCAFCLEMHSTQALEMGETVERIVALSAWQDSPLFSETERTALKFAEQLNACNKVDDTTYQALLATFGEQGLTFLTIAINAITGWNRIVKVFLPEVGSWRT